MSNKTVLTDPINERSTAIIVATIADEDETAITLAQLGTITMTLYDIDTAGIINSRTSQDIKNTNNVAITAAGVMTWTMQQADNNISTATKSQEWHRALFEWTFGTPTKYGKYELEFSVLNLTKVSTP